MLEPSTISAFIFLGAVVIAFFFIYEFIEKIYSPEIAKFSTDIFLVIPVMLGIYSASVEIRASEEEKRIQRETINQQIRLQKIDEISREASVAMAAVADVARQLRWNCATAEAQVLNRSLARGLSEECQRRTNQAQCWQLDNVRRNSEVWAASPTRAAEFYDHRDVQCYLGSLESAFPQLEQQIEQRSIRVFPLVLNLRENLGSLNRIIGQGGGLAVPPALAPSDRTYFWFWLLVFAAGVEIGRKLHLYLYDRVFLGGDDKTGDP